MLDTRREKMNLLQEMELENEVVQIADNKFRYDYEFGSIYLLFLGEKKESNFFDLHLEIWSENSTEFFISVFEEKDVHFCDSKTKPNLQNPIQSATIDSFQYGTNTPKAKQYLELLKKDNIDTGVLLEEIRGFIEKRKHRITIDQDLLENLEMKKKTLCDLLKDFHNPENIAQKLIDRCLFIRCIEDRIALVIG